jgi:esterase/lipase
MKVLLQVLSLGLMVTCAHAGDSDSSPIPAVVGAPVAAAGSEADFTAAVASFQQYIATKQVRAPGDLPFILSHGHKTPGAVLMVHGLTDSPYYMRTLADILYNAGYNVAAVLLPGHGTKPEDLLNVKLAQWREEVQFGLGVVKRLGETVSLAGFSCGGALSLDALAANYQGPSPIPLQNLLLFSPAIKIANREAELACLPGVREVMERTHPWAAGDASTPETNPNKYAKMALNAVCELNDLIGQNSSRRADIMRDIKDHGIGVFTVESGDDTTIDPDSVKQFMAALPSGARQDFIFYPKDDGIAHASVTRPETNPYYGALASQLATFVSEPTGPAIVRSCLPLPPMHSPALDGLMAGRAF